ncbi:sphingomyelin phosphodiesterase 4-like [Ctenocephalides felis]|uniref:sphingomyelin phosphodiesterase 4-like n=1 Tax=Ctenocephalides felis TaxID=7515 RepID=UPI000E6E42FB|nr:sphingomyelin phosphodiesterase 4-like [Ctenocephalides felis]
MSVRYDPNQSFAQLKNSTWKIFQDKFYLFLKQMLNRWPMDHNFILIVEMWLSFIQPWRYDRCNPPQIDAVEINHQCKAFIMDNILAYTQTFQQILARIERLDLVVSKNASLLYRVAKVFSRQPLPKILFEIEIALTEPSPESPTPGNRSGSPKFNQSFNENLRIADAIRQRVLQLEGPEFKYKSMFRKTNILEIAKLLKHMQECINKSKQQVAILEHTLKLRKTGFMNYIKYMLDMTESSDLEHSIAEGKKIPGYLEVSSQYLCQIFNIDYSELKLRINQQLKDSETFTCDPTTSFEGTSFNSIHSTGSHFVLNYAQVKEYARNMKYMGDPDLIPPSSYEMKFVVDKCFALSRYLNCKYGTEFKDLWFNDKFVGSVARQILMPPMIARYFARTKFDYSSLETKVLPPRLSLRPLANMKSWFYIAIILLLGQLIGYSCCTTSLFLLVIFVIYILALASFWDTGVISEVEIAAKNALPKIKIALGDDKKKL